MTSTNPVPYDPTTHLNKALALLDDFFVEVGKETQQIGRDRVKLQGRVTHVVKVVEEKLQALLNGQPLRGCPNLLTSDKPVFGYNVRKAQKTAKLPFPDGAQDQVDALILSRDGLFTIVEVGLRATSGPAHERLLVDFAEPEDDDIQIEDLRPIMETVVEACVKHLLHTAETTAKNTKRVRELADAVLDALLNEGSNGGSGEGSSD